MTDLLVNLGTNRTARAAVRRMGLSLPPTLRRDLGPWSDRPLADQHVMVGLPAGAQLAEVLARTVAGAGATALLVVGDEALAAPFTHHGEAHGWPPLQLEPDEVPVHRRPAAMVIDASGLDDPAQLGAIHALTQPRLRSLASCGRVVLLGRPVDSATTPAQAAARAAISGLARSLARELGRNGSTAHLIVVEPGAEDRLEPLLRWLLSPRSAYVSGQVLTLSAAVRQATPPPTRRPLDGKVALVTGAARGIGKATAAALAREGATVIVADLPSADGPASKLADEIGGVPLLLDIASAEAGDTVAELLMRRFDGVIDIVVHNAGITRDKMAVNMDAERFSQVLDVNLRAVLRLDDALLAHLADGGRLVYLSSVTGIAGNAGQTNYSASKAGIIGYVGALARQLAGRGVAVNAVAPGFIETAMTAHMPVATRQVARRLCNLSQGGLPVDVAEVIMLLASPGAAGLSGQVVRVCGGSLLGA